MVIKILNNKPVQITLSAIIIFGALICVFTPNYLLFKIGSSFAVHIMLSYLLLGILFLALRQPRLMFTSFMCCAGLCLFLKYNSNWKWPVVHTKDPYQPLIQLAHFNIANADLPYEATMASIIKANADVLSFQEVTPDWHQYFQHFLKDKYPYSASIVRLDPYGLAIYSKRKIVSVDTFFYKEIPNLVVEIQSKKHQEPFRLISSYTTPPLYGQALENLGEHMTLIAEQVNDTNLPTIAFGDYNAPSWWDEVRILTNEGQLTDSRSCVTPGLDNLWKYPVDYIFHSKHFNCLDFNKVEYTLYGHLGIQATFQLNNADNHDQAALK